VLATPLSPLRTDHSVAPPPLRRGRYATKAPGHQTVLERARITLAPVTDDLDRIASWLREARHVTVLTGAGISTESGIPDFRGPQGLWTKNPAAEKTATLEYYLSDPEIRRTAWHNRVNSEMWSAEPNDAHRALVDLEKRDALHALVTQNVDGLHHAAGQSPELVVEIHGNVREVKCMSCGWRGPMQDTLDRVRAGEEDPECLACGGILKSATISFGENLVADDLDRSQLMAGRADVFCAIGTSLAVYPAAGLPEIALRNGAWLVILNAEPTPFDPLAAAVVSGRLGEVLPAIVERV
jgi:NAD-dependent deacetylase